MYRAPLHDLSLDTPISQRIHRALDAPSVFRRNESGQVAIEYALIVASVAFGGAGLASALAPDLGALFGGIETQVCEQIKAVCTTR